MTSFDPALVVVFSSLLLTLILMPSSLRLAHRWELLDKPSRHKRHKRAVPIIGGLVLFVSLWVSVVISWVIFPSYFADLAGTLPYIFSGALIITLVGFSDDLAPLSASTKLIAQIAAGLVLVIGGLEINPISVPLVGTFEIGRFSIAVTVIWVIVLTNAVNLIDGLDGLAAGVSAIAAVTMVVISSLYGGGSAALFVYALIGFLVVFLVYNRYPARVFLGDSGSLQIGYYFAVVSLLLPIKSFTTAALYPPLLVLGVPLLETTMSISRRIITGKNIMKADRRHLFHYLSLAGLSHRAVVYVFYLLSVVFSLFALAMYFWDRLVVFGFLILFMVVVLVLFLIFMGTMSRPGRAWKRVSNK